MMNSGTCITIGLAVQRCGTTWTNSDLVYLDIKTPQAMNLEELGDLVTLYPAVMFLFGVADHSSELLRLRADAVLAIDLAYSRDTVDSVSTEMDARGRTYWLGDGNMPLLPKPSMRTSFQLFRKTNAAGTFAWCYSNLDALKHDIVYYKVNLVTVNRALVKAAAGILKRHADE
jgi:hypothetical protein